VKQRGRPIRGAIAGLFFGLFVSLDLVIFGVLALDADVLAFIPLLGLVAGVLLGVMAPLGRRSAEGKRARVPSVGGPKADPSAA
jgi:hypothetical protein